MLTFVLEKKKRKFESSFVKHSTDSPCSAYEECTSVAQELHRLNKNLIFIWI